MSSLSAQSGSLLLAFGLLAGAATGGAMAQGLVLEDATAATGLAFTHFNGMVGELYFSEMMGSGVGLFDYDGDGDLDLYLVQGAWLPGRPEATAPDPAGPHLDRLLRADRVAGGGPGLRWVDVTERSGLAGDGYGMGVATGDFDGDGWTDLYLTNLGPNQLWRNGGDGTFADVTAAARVGDVRWAVSASFADVDGDGRLDLYVGNYVDFRAATHKQCVSATGLIDYCGPLAYSPEADVLYRNLGGGVFEDVSRRAGVEEHPGGALGVAALDADGDGWTDFYVANDQVPNKLWHNDGRGAFVDEALIDGAGVNEAGAPEASMGLAVADLTGDGSLDVFISHLTGETNTLYQRQPGGYYEDATRRSGLGLPSFPSTGFGIAAQDFDLDGWPDLFVANGAVKRMQEQVDAGDPHPLRQRDQLFRNLGRGRFSEVTEEAGEALAVVDVSRGVAAGDVDGDGAGDLVLSNNDGPARLLLDRSPGRGSWLGVAPIPPGGAAWTGAGVEAIGLDGVRPAGRVVTDGSYASARDPRVLVGLGAARQLPAVRIRWTGGRARELRAPPLDRYLVVPAP
jgi:enediyne biosynthesis protein E4